MIKRLLFLCFVLLINFGYSQDQSEYKTFDAGEWLRYRLHYGFFNASYATLSVKDTVFRGEPAFHAIGEGRTTGFAFSPLGTLIPHNFLAEVAARYSGSIFQRE